MRDRGESVYAVVVTLDERIPNEAQSAALMSLEWQLRRLTGMDVRVMKAKMGDDSKLRMAMTNEERNTL